MSVCPIGLLSVVAGGAGTSRRYGAWGLCCVSCSSDICTSRSCEGPDTTTVLPLPGGCQEVVGTSSEAATTTKRDPCGASAS